MFGLSLSKILLVVLVAAAVWYGVKWLKRARTEPAAKDGAGRAADRGTDLAACPACGTYVAAPVATCPNGRADCPMVGA